MENTVFLVAQFLCWTELVRREIQFLERGDDLQTKALRALQDEIYTLFQTDKLEGGFRLFAGEQRAIGELMMDRAPTRPDCIGYAAFLQARNPLIDRWLDDLRQDIERMATDLAPHRERLSKLQDALIRLLRCLDPHFVRFPRQKRTSLLDPDPRDGANLPALATAPPVARRAPSNGNDGGARA